MKGPAEKTGELLLDGRNKGVSVDGVEGVLEVERDTRTLLWSMSKVFWTLCTTFSALSRMPILNWAGAKDSRGSSPFDVGHDGGAHYLMKKIVPIEMGDGWVPLSFFLIGVSLPPKKKKRA